MMEYKKILKILMSCILLSTPLYSAEPSSQELNDLTTNQQSTQVATPNQPQPSIPTPPAQTNNSSQAPTNSANQSSSPTITQQSTQVASPNQAQPSIPTPPTQTNDSSQAPTNSANQSSSPTTTQQSSQVATQNQAQPSIPTPPAQTNNSSQAPTNSTNQSSSRTTTQSNSLEALRAKQSEYLSGITSYETSLSTKQLTEDTKSNINWMKDKFYSQLEQVNNELKKAGMQQEYPFSQKINTPVMLLTVVNSFSKSLKVATESEIDELLQKNSELPKQQQLPLSLQVGQLIVAPDELDLTSVFFIAPIENQSYYGLLVQLPDPVTGKMTLRPIYWDFNKKIMFVAQDVIGRNPDQKIILQNDDNLVKLDFVKVANKEFFCLKKAGNLVDQTDTSSGTGFFGFKTQVDNLGLLFDRDPVASLYRGISQDEAIKFIVKKLATPDVLDYFVPASLDDFTKDDFRDLLKNIMQLLNLAYYNNLGQFHNDLILGLRNYLCNKRGESVFSEEKLISFLGVKINPSDSTPWMEMILTNLQGKADPGQSWGFQFSAEAQDAINLLFKVYVTDAKTAAILKIQAARKQTVDQKLEALKTNENFDNYITLFKALANPEAWFEGTASTEDVSPASDETLTKSLSNLDEGITKLKGFVKTKKDTEVKTTEEWNKYSQDLSSAKELQKLIGLIFANQFTQLLLKKAYQSFELMNNPDEIAKALSNESTFNEQVIKALSKRLIEPRDFSQNENLLKSIKSKGFDLVSLYNDLRNVLNKKAPAQAVAAKPVKPKKATKFNMIDISALNTTNPLQNTVAAATITDPYATAPTVTESSGNANQESSPAATPVDTSGL